MRWLLGVPARLLRWVSRPAKKPEPMALEQVAEALEKGGSCRESYLALEPDVVHLQTPAGLLSYAVEGAVAFGVGGVNAVPERKAEMLQTFLARTWQDGCRRRLFFPLRDEDLEAAEEVGMATLLVGEEAVLDLDGLTFRGNRYETVRQMCNRMNRLGLEVREVSPDTYGAQMETLHQLWLTSKRPNWRMRFLIGTPSVEQPFGRRYIAGFHEGELMAFITLIPGSEGEWAVDVMCRRPGSPTGAMERLIVEAVRILQSEGARILSLGPCPMAGTDTIEGHGFYRWIFQWLYHSPLGNRLFGFSNLHRFKKKFRPRWVPVYIAAPKRVRVTDLYLGCHLWGLF